MDRETGFSHEVKVKLEEFGKYRGYSDLVQTYCCSSTPCYYVIFPGIGYEGYFAKYDVEVKRK